jgi:hypothetical protein
MGFFTCNLNGWQQLCFFQYETIQNNTNVHTVYCPYKYKGLVKQMSYFHGIGRPKKTDTDTYLSISIYRYRYIGQISILLHHKYRYIRPTFWPMYTGQHRSTDIALFARYQYRYRLPIQGRERERGSLTLTLNPLTTYHTHSSFHLTPPPLPHTSLYRQNWQTRSLITG